MAEPIDRKLFALSSAVATDGLAFIERRISATREIKPYDNWPTISWSQGMPDFSFYGDEPPIDYTDAFSPMWSLAALLGAGTDREEFDFAKQQTYQELKRYIRSQPAMAPRMFNPNAEESELDDFSLRWFVEQAINRYIHVVGTRSFDSGKFLEIYLPLEAGVLLEELPIEILIPILLVRFSSDSYDLENTISITRMSEPLQLARARRDHDTHDVNEHLLQQASHALVLRDHVLPNSEYHQRFWGYSVSQASLDIVETFFACLRIVTSIETGYAQVLFVPVGWAHSYTASLPPLEGLTTRKYPPNLHPVSAFNEASSLRCQTTRSKASKTSSGTSLQSRIRAKEADFG